MITVLLISLLASHLLCMNVSSAGPLLCLVLNRKRTPGDESQPDRTAVQLAMWSLLLLFIGTALGIALGYVQIASGDISLSGVFPLFANKIRWGILELICSAGWMLGYWGWLRWKPPTGSVMRWLHNLLAVLASTNLLYHFPPLLTIMSKAASGEIAITEHVDAATFRELCYTPNVLAHALHFLFASIAVAGVFTMMLANRSENPERPVVLGARAALVATSLQLPAGIWLLFVTPAASQAKLMGGDGIATMLFAGSLFCVFYLLHHLSTLAFGEVDQRAPMRCAALLIGVVWMMTGVLHFIRI